MADYPTLAEGLAECRAAELKQYPYPFVSEFGDFMDIHLEDAACLSERIDDFLTIDRACSDGRIVGFTLKGLKRLAEHVLNVVTINDGEVSIQLLLLSASGANQSTRKFYYDVAKMVEKLTVPVTAIKLSVGTVAA